MAVFVLLYKEYEDEVRIVYKYGPNEITYGKIEYNKVGRSFEQIQSIHKEGVSDQFYINLAAQRIARIVGRENSIFSSKITIES